MIRGLRHSARLVRVVWTLARHGAVFPLEALGDVVPRPVLAALRWLGRGDLHRRPGRRLAEALQTLGPSFVKLGQSLAVRRDLLGDDVAEDLSALQDHLPPFPVAEARRTVAHELGKTVEELFARFDETPAAAASIAQVHFAETPDGRAVAVKILRPGIEAAFARDLAFFYWLAHALERRIPALRRLKPVEVVRRFDETVIVEMDMRLEAAAATELAENFADDPDFRVPAVDWERTGQRVLVLERVEGIRIDEVDALRAAGLDPKAVLERSARAFFRQVFRDGFFHADMHPGNMFVRPDGALSPVDFGIMGRLDRRTRNFLADMLLGFLQRDYRRVAEVHFAAGYVPADRSHELFMQACRAIGEPIFGKPQSEISVARLLGQLFRVTSTFAMEAQPQLLLLQKTMLVAEGVGRRLDPDTNMWLLAEPLVEDWMREHRGPEARLREAAGEVARRIERLPAMLESFDRLAAMATEDGIRLHPDTLRGLRRDVEAHIGRWRTAAAVLAAVLVLVLVAG